MSPGGTRLVFVFVSLFFFLSEAAINILFVLARHRLCPDRGAETEVGHLCIAFCMAMGSWWWGFNFFVFLMHLILLQVSLVTGLGKKQGKGWERG